MWRSETYGFGFVSAFDTWRFLILLTFFSYFACAAVSLYCLFIFTVNSVKELTS
jgi:hypothetical protein